MISVLALPLEEGVKLLEERGMQCQCKILLPPREKAEDYQNREVRKYIVRQQLLSDTQVELTIVFR